MPQGDFLSRALMAIVGSQNPELFVEYASAQGAEPPDGAPSGQPNVPSLEALLRQSPQSPLAGVQAPPQPDVQLPATPAAPRPSQSIQPAETLTQLLLRGQAQGVQSPTLGGVPTLASLV